MRRDIQVVVTILSIDEENDPDFIALLTASTALSISDIPWSGPVAGVKIMRGAAPGSIIVNPTNAEVASGFSLVGFVAGTEGKINMVELEGKECGEDSAVEAFEVAQREIDNLVAWQRGVVSEIGKQKAKVNLAEAPAELAARVRTFIEPRLEAAIYVEDKVAREENLASLERDLALYLAESAASDADQKLAKHLLEESIDAKVHEGVLKGNRRPDGRALDKVRDLYGEVGLLNRTHGSAIFIRGNTQALAITTLGPPSAQQLVETIEFTGKKRFMLHYNFPSYSVGEIGPFRGPGRREIGHGALASKAIKNLIPDASVFPYTIRVVSEVLSSNGSSSMATVCATSLSLMDAGVPIAKPVAGIAMGLMSDDQGSYKVLTDIQGPEDHYGDMDFKAAGTADGLTAIQMDIQGVTPKVLSETLAAAKAARLTILGVMNSVLPKSRDTVSKHAPVIKTVVIPKEKIGEVIGPGGKIINGLIEKTGVLSIDIEEDGTVFVTGPDYEKVDLALASIRGIVKTYEVGEIVEGTVVRIMDFGAIVEFGPNQDGMIHVSELKNGFVKRVEDVVKVGDFVRAKIIRVEDGRVGLSLKNL
jgi:polyribonucleotide nucleotidyltransferase